MPRVVVGGVVAPGGAAVLGLAGAAPVITGGHALAAGALVAAVLLAAGRAIMADWLKTRFARSFVSAVPVQLARGTAVRTAFW